MILSWTILSYTADTKLPWLKLKGGITPKMYWQELWFLWSAHRLMMLYISVKICEYLLNGFQVIEWTRFCDRRTDGRTDGQTTKAKKICLHRFQWVGERHNNNKISLKSSYHKEKQHIYDLNVSYHKEQQYIWFRVGFWTVSEILSLRWTRGIGAYPRATPSQCHWMRLIIRNNNINGLVCVWRGGGGEILSLI